MNILIITNSYPPEVRSTSHLMYEMATELKTRGHGVTVLTSFPGYNLAEGVDIRKIGEVTDEAGVLILRARTMPLKKVGYLQRGVAELALPLNFWNLLKQHANSFDMIWVFSPPLTLALLAGWVKNRCGGRILMNAQDIFPQNGIDLGIISNPALIAWYEFLESRAYRLSDVILVHSEKNRQFLVENKEISPDRVVMQHNWVDLEPFEWAERTGRFRAMYGIDGQKAILFAGVFGPSQGLEQAIELASRLRDREDIIFLLVGDGSEKTKLQNRVRDLGLNNVLLKPFVSKDDYPYLVKDADIGLTCLSQKVKTPVVPGKIQGYMAAGVPILGILNEESDGHELVRRAEAGLTVRAEDMDSAETALTSLLDDHDLRRQYGSSGHAYAARYLSKQACIDNILSLVKTPSSV